MLIRKARAIEVQQLSNLCFRSKAVWGYDDDFMELCRDELTMTPQDLSRSNVVVAQEDEKILGLAQLYINADIASLEKLFVDPLALRCAVGTRLFNWAKRQANTQKASILQVISDPYAKEFYVQMGGSHIKDVSSQTGENRFLPLFEYTLETF